MKIAEKLYQQGYISYPRTETNKYAQSINIKDLVKNIKHGPWSDFADRILDGTMYDGPRAGKQDDKAHPPIHPTKLATQD